MTDDKTLNELTELLRTATVSAEDMVDQWGPGRRIYESRAS